MYLFERLFGGLNKNQIDMPPAAGQKAKAHAAPTAPGTTIRHDPQLVAELKREHKALLEIFGSLERSAKGGDVAAVRKRLEQFRDALQDHLLKENVRLYVYLEHMLESDATGDALIHEFRVEMDGIGRNVIAFLNRYKSIDEVPALLGQLRGEIESIGQALSGRIRCEESTLYPMYRPPS